MGIQQERKRGLRTLTDQTGVYALCDLDQVPIYIGQSTDGIRTRVSRHLTSARSDVIANRQLDVWEVSQVWAWPVEVEREAGEADKAYQQRRKEKITALENCLIHHYNDRSPLVNGKIPPLTGGESHREPDQKISMIPDEERQARLAPDRRLPRQVEHFNNLFSHVLEVKNNVEQRRMLRVHISRMRCYYEDFMKSSNETELYVGDSFDE